MADPYVFGASGFPYEDMSVHSQAYTGLDGLTYIDPALQSPTSVPYSNNVWDAGLKETSTTAFFTAEISRHIRPVVGIPAGPLPPQARFASPVSLIEPSPSTSAHSPRADTESYYDNSFPTTPPDTALLSPFQPSVLDPFSTAHAVQFTSMGPTGYVSPFDVNPAQQQQPEYSEGDNTDVADFSFPQYSFDSHLSDESAQMSAITDLCAQPVASPEPMQPDAADVLGAASRYPLLPKVEEEDSTSEEDEALYKRQNDDDADGDYQPSKRQKTSTRTPARRGARAKAPAATAAAPSSRQRGTRAANPTTTARAIPSMAASGAKGASLTCSECDQRLPSKAELDAHVKKQHQRPFNCVFDFAGCTSTFASKNEWKRHVNTQHLLLHYWVCTEGDCAKARPSGPVSSASASPSPATPSSTTDPATGTTIFNRKDLFTQHLKRMHAPKPIKQLLLPAHKRSSTTSTPSTTTTTPDPNDRTSTSTSTSSTPSETHLLAAWESRLRTLHQTACRPRCALPTLMRCPVASCPAAPFRGPDAWNQRMEHVAKHMERAGRGEEGRVVFGGGSRNTQDGEGEEIGDGDETLVKWAGRGDVGIIVWREDGGKKGGGGRWVLKAPLKRGPGGSVVVTTATAAAAATDAVVKEEEVEEEGEEIVVGEGGEDVDDEEEDAEGEDD